MPSEDRVTAALKVLAPARDAFHGAVVAAVEELRGYLAANRPAGDSARVAAASLGQFAAGLIDPARFGALFAHDGRLTPDELTRLEQALETIRDFAREGDDLYTVRVPDGADLRDSIRSALAVRGRVFAAARGAEVIRRGRGQQVLADEYGGFPFRLWNRAERQIAPPLVVEVAGGALHVSGLAEYLDGRFKVVLVVKDPTPSAPLARLIGPGVFVQQAGDAASLEQLIAFDGPGVAALMPEGSASFTWDPSAVERLQVRHLPAEEQVHAIGTVAAAQQHADVQWLKELAVAFQRVAEAEVEANGADRVELLTAWLLRQSNLDGV